METDFLKELKKYQSEVFNIFSVVVGRSETSHSAFIAELLNPKGTHGYKSQFLFFFLEGVKYPHKTDLDNFEVKPEYDIRNGGDGDRTKNSEVDKKGRIDIFIHNQNECIVIENKIDANDQPEQLYRYHKFCGEKYKNYKLFYLTPRGKNATEDSTRGELQVGEHYFCISYEEHIKAWLSRCIDIIPVDDKLKDIVKQYIDFLEDEIVNSVENAQKAKRWIAENIDTAWKHKDDIFALKIFKHVKWHTVDDFFRELSGQLNLTCPDMSAEITKATHKKRGGQLILTFKLEGVDFQIVNDYQGFTLGNVTTNKWGKFFPDSAMVFANFDNRNTFELINDKNRSKLIEKIVKLIKEEVKSNKICVEAYK